MNKQESIEKIGFYIDSEIYGNQCDDNKLGIGYISENSQELIDAWNYIKENLK